MMIPSIGKKILYLVKGIVVGRPVRLAPMGLTKSHYADTISGSSWFLSPITI